MVKDLVEKERAMQPRLGGLKLHKMLRFKLEDAGVSLGRDRFFEVLKNQGLLLKRLPKAPQTTCMLGIILVYSKIWLKNLN